jgi:hypothetical protein
MSMLYRYIHDQMRLAPGVPRGGGIDARCGGEGACCRWLKGLGVKPSVKWNAHMAMDQYL